MITSSFYWFYLTSWCFFIS